MDLIKTKRNLINIYKKRKAGYINSHYFVNEVDYLEKEWNSLFSSSVVASAVGKDLMNSYIREYPDKDDYDIWISDVLASYWNDVDVFEKLDLRKRVAALATGLYLANYPHIYELKEEILVKARNGFYDKETKIK